MDIWTEAAERGVLGAGVAEVRPGRPCERIIRMAGLFYGVETGS